jgi:predicted AlkP superfamily phosphohydrolase/phosphomutase
VKKKMGKITRRDFLSQTLKVGAGLSLWPVVSSCTPKRSISISQKKMVILGIDGMDPFLLVQFVKQGAMPNFQRLINETGLRKMRSSIPPQSPVAWSDFAVGSTSHIHGIFDFIHRDPRTMTPYLSTSTVSSPNKTVSIGDWQIPLTGGTAENLREGKPFWDHLGEAGVPTTVFKMPGDFPVNSQNARCVSGMGTPDILGSYGTFSLFTSNPPHNAGEITGGAVFPIKIVENKIEADLLGPVNTLRKERPRAKIPFVVWRDPQHDVVKVNLQDQELIMTPGEWSEWLQISFDLVPHLNSVKGICKILIKQVHPHFEMYVSPINIDPTDQTLPVTSPEAYGKELFDHIGLYSTKGLPADTKALSYGAISEEEYLDLSGQILDESKKAFSYELNKLRDQSNGFLFFYFYNLDQDTHMYWRAIDTAHPLYTPTLGEKYYHAIRSLYIEMDRVLGEVYRNFDIKDENFRLVVMSDHGFAPFYRSVNLNTWLLYNGYVDLSDPSAQEDQEFFENVNWSKTKAYGLGINALYLNLKGRERYGIISKNKAQETVKKLKSQLLALKDPHNGENAISNIWVGKEIYGREDDKTPDLIIGWNRGYRASWDTVLGGFPRDVFVNNDDKWSGDHCIDPFWVPAVLLSNKKITKRNLRLRDVTATVLSEFNIPIPPQMTGKPIYEI